MGRVICDTGTYQKGTSLKLMEVLVKTLLLESVENGICMNFQDWIYMCVYIYIYINK